MTEIARLELPDEALLRQYHRDQRAGGYTDCYATVVDQRVSLADFVHAFYTTRLFGLERWLLKLVVDRPSTDQNARDVASGAIDAFAAWTVEQRAERQLLMCDMHAKTRSWFMVEPITPSGQTRLLFGSAVVPGNKDEGKLGWAVRAAMPVHKVYSTALLKAARRRLLDSKN
ncbi:MAG: hypothetical protein AB8G17_06380 [Gammaproteobacteria bacterium]